MLKALKQIEYLHSRVTFVFTAAKAWTDTTTTDQSETASEAPSTPLSDPVQLRTPGGGKKHHFIPKTVQLGTGYEPVFTCSHTEGTWCFLCLGDQVWILCGLWEENKVWKDLSSLPGLSGGDPPRVPWPLPHALQSHHYWHSHEDNRGASLNYAFSPHPRRSLLIPQKSKWMYCFQGATLADFAPVTSPQIPVLVIYCIKEIEKRGLHEVRRSTVKSWSTCHMHVLLYFQSCGAHFNPFLWRRLACTESLAMSAWSKSWKRS